MSKTMECLGLGAGAIGKSISGYIFTRLGWQFTYAEINDAIIADINARGGYDLYSGDKEAVKQEIRGISAVHAASEAAAELAQTADVIVTAVGSTNLRAAAASIASWIPARPAGKRLAILLFENGTELKELVEGVLKEKLGAIPPEISVSHASIERISKTRVNAEGGFDGVSEPFIPPILTRKGLEDTAVALHTDYFELVDDVNRYYYRKLYLNNIGHAVLSYVGSAFGMTTTVEAVRDERVLKALWQVWDATGRMVRLKYGFTEQEVDEYFAGRLRCYQNVPLSDPLARLARAPMRKLGRHERIVGAADQCLQYGVAINAFGPLLYYAMHYFNFEDEESIRLSILKERKGVETVLQEVCELQPEEPLYAQLLQLYLEENLLHSPARR